MAAPTLPYTLTNGSTADASQVQSNDQALLDAITDGTKDLTFNNLTANGDVALGSSSTDTTTLNGKFSGTLQGSGHIKYGAYQPGWVNNLGISLSAGTLTITDASGSALSTTNIGYVTVPSTSAGQVVALKVTAPASFNDDAHASSDLTSLGFGITESANWAVDHPFFLYVANRANSDLDGNDGSSVFFLARNPCLTSTPSDSNNIGDSGLTGVIPVNDSQNVILILDDVTIANYTSLPCQLIGALRMRWATATTDWTVQTIGNNDGFGKTQLDKTFATTWSFPQAQNGAETSTFFDNSAGGTAPTFTTNIYGFKINPDGTVFCNGYLNAGGGTAGSGAFVARMALPYTASTLASATVADTVIGTALGATTITGGTFALGSIANAVSYVDLYYMSSLTTISAITNAMFSGAASARTVSFSFKFNAF